MPDTFSGLRERLAVALDGPWRRNVAEAAARRKTSAEMLAVVRTMMRSHVWTAEGRSLPLTAHVSAADRQTRAEGFHALNDWDGVAAHVNVEIIPVDVLDYVRRISGAGPADPAVAHILIDYYFFHLLSLLSLRAWDVPSPDRAWHEVAALLDALQGPDGSGQPFVNDAETLLLIATSHYEPKEHGYTTLLEQVAGLPAAHRHAIAMGHAACLGSHLRFGYLATYGRRVTEMRDDNAADYPWLYWSIGQLLERLANPSIDPRDTSREAIIEAVFSALTADAEEVLRRQDIAGPLRSLAQELMPVFAALEPDGRTYSPLCFLFNFSYNIVKGTVIDAALRAEPWTVSYNDLLSGGGGGRSSLVSREALARRLMDYARRNPHRIRGELLPVVAYDVHAGRAAHASTMATLSAFIDQKPVAT